MRSNIELMAGLVGRVIQVESPDESRFSHRNFGRARIEIDIEKPLMPGFLAPRPDERMDDVWIQIRYEKLIRYCFNCGKLGHESRVCEEEAVEFVVNGVNRRYDASLCAQALRSQAITQVGRGPGRATEKGLMHRDGENRRWMHGNGDQAQGSKEKGESSTSQQLKRQDWTDKMAPKDFNSVNRSREEILRMGMGLNIANQQIGPGSKLGQILKAHLHAEGVTEVGLETLIRKMDGSIGMLRARKDKLKRAQTNYWVELAEDEDKVMKEDKAIVSIQQEAIGELAQGLKEVSLKRKVDEGADSPVHKRRKDHDQDSPKGAGDRVRAELDLKQWEENEGSALFNFRYEGSLNFSPGSNTKKYWKTKRKVRKALFNGPENTVQLVIKDECSREEVHMEERNVREEGAVDEGCGGWPESATGKL